MSINSSRTVTTNIVSKIILVLIIISFILTGINNYIISDYGNYAAKVNSYQISYSQLEQAIQRERDHQQKYINRQFSKLSINEDSIRQKTLSQLIDVTLLDQYANKLKLVISDDQIKQAILAIPDFCSEGKFSNIKFRLLINKMGLSSDQYAALIRKKLLIQQLIQGVVNTCLLLPVEIDRLMEIISQTREVRLAKFDISSLEKKQTVNEDEIYKNYNTYKNKYVLSEAFKVSYIPINIEAIQEKTTVDEQEIQIWYNQHHDQFIIPEHKHYSIIQSKSKNNVNECLKKLKQGISFSDLAKVYSTDIFLAKNSGDIGWISDKNTLYELKKANLKKKGQVSDVIKSSVGFFIIRLNDIQPKKILPLRKVYDEVAFKVKQEKTIDSYRTLQKKINDAAKNNSNILELAETASGIKAQQTDWFDKNNIPEAINYNAVKKVLFHKLLFNRKGIPSNNSNIITIDKNRTFIIRITDYRPERIQPFKNVHMQIENEIKRKKALEKARFNVEKILIALKQNKNEKVLKTLGLSFSTPKQFHSINQDNPIVQTIFSLPKPPYRKSSYAIANNSHGDIVLIALDRIMSRILDKPERKQLVDKLNQWMSDIIFETLLMNLHAKAKIKIGVAAQI
ncbi:Peptidyl-prolyl cis-trans isomerase D [Candidatus Gullanella endobia]|uniref:Periplasmic chaperone PpiD n=1 Tax=Candidatus Gullanella endobia TaxID=1070130 RepID=A0A143WQM0_9ENTR|nr:peptidylprolyl isomerase [Candidatus Gullanella endobia]CUX95847.1 Peptidyl-prolyl cis-trans isomerase D [Candidatus Gullanella endobia]